MHFSFTGNTCTCTVSNVIIPLWCKLLLEQIFSEHYSNVILETLQFDFLEAVEYLLYVLKTFSWIVRNECAINSSVLSHWRIHRPGTVMRITCSVWGNSCLVFLDGTELCWHVCLLSSHVRPHTAPDTQHRCLGEAWQQEAFRWSWLATHTPSHTMYILGEIQLSSSFKCPMGVMPRPYNRLRIPLFSSLSCSCPPTFHPFLLCFHFQNICWTLDLDV